MDNLEKANQLLRLIKISLEGAGHKACLNRLNDSCVCEGCDCNITLESQILLDIAAYFKNMKAV